jgi:hypothetical protein
LRAPSEERLSEFFFEEKHVDPRSTDANRPMHLLSDPVILQQLMMAMSAVVPDRTG